jgi:hypothetical protein
VGKVIMMPLLLLILVPLAVLFIVAVVYDLRRRGLSGAPGRNRISPDTARAIVDAKAAEHFPGGGGI